MTPTEAEVSRGLKDVQAVLEAIGEPEGLPVPPEIAARVRRDRLFGQLGERAIALLRELEWCNGDIADGKCPVCFSDESEGHAPDCRLAALLKEADGGS